MFNMNEFLMKTIKGMIGAYPDFQVREYALNWYAKGKLTEEDLAEIDTLVEAQYIVTETPVDETVMEENTEVTEDTFVDEFAEPIEAESNEDEELY